MRTRSFLLAALLALPLGAQTVRDQLLVSTGWLQHHRKGVTILHAGTRAEYDTGHIPGAVNVPMGANLKADGTLRPVGELRALYERAGVTKDCVNVAYCRTGMLSSVTYFVLAYLGYDAALYDGSFVEWSNAGEIS